MSVTFTYYPVKAQSEVRVEKVDFSSMCHFRFGQEMLTFGLFSHLAHHTPPENRKVWTPVERTDGPLSVLFIFSIFKCLRNYFHKI